MSIITSKQARHVLWLLVGIAFLVLIGPTILTKADLNLFNRNLIRLWGLEPRPLSAGFCEETADQHSLQKLNAMSKYIATHEHLSNLSQGMLACLKGDSHAAEEIWLNGRNNNISTSLINTYFASLSSFTENRIIDTSHATDLGT